MSTARDKAQQAVARAFKKALKKQGTVQNILGAQEVKPEKYNQNNQSTTSRRFLRFIENPLTLAGFGTIAGVAGVFLYTPILLASGLLLLIGFYRSGAVSGLPRWKQIGAWIALSVIVWGSLWGMETLIHSKLQETLRGGNTSPFLISAIMGKLGSIATKLDQLASAKFQTADQPLTRADLNEAIKEVGKQSYVFITDGARVLPKVSYATRVEFCEGCCSSFGDSISFGLNVDLSSIGRLPAINLRHLTKVFISDHPLSTSEETAYAEEAKVEFKKQAPISTVPKNTIVPGETIKFFTICDARFTEKLEQEFRSGASLIYVRMVLVYRDKSMPASKVGVTESWGWYKRNYLSLNLCHDHNRAILLNSDLSDL
jgi:hypothetical protein